MNPRILFRKSLAEEGEIEVAKKYFEVVEHRTNILKDDLVIGRYSVLPYYLELEKDINNLGANLINSYSQYNYAADIQNWYYDLESLTPNTWFRAEDVPPNCPGSFILKGRTNSRKQLWRTHMFAPTRKDIVSVMCNLFDDSLLQYQGICVRQFENLINYGEDPISHCPISKEFRLFILNNKVIAKGFYWSNWYEDISLKPSPEEIPESFIKEIIKRVDGQINFWSLDVAQKTNGEWIVVEIGDGQMSGVSCCGLEELYGNMKAILV